VILFACRCAQVFDYYAGGAESEATLRDNREAFSRYRLLPRMLVDVSRIDTRCTLFGASCPHLHTAYAWTHTRRLRLLAFYSASITDNQKPPHTCLYQPRGGSCLRRRAVQNQGRQREGGQDRVREGEIGVDHRDRSSGGALSASRWHSQLQQYYPLFQSPLPIRAFAAFRLWAPYLRELLCKRAKMPLSGLDLQPCG
jgi:hypothetical protein